MAVVVPKHCKQLEHDVIMEGRRGFDNTCGEFNRQIENFRQAGYQPGILRIFAERKNSMIENFSLVNPADGEDKDQFHFLLVVPRIFRTIFDQMSALGKIDENIDPQDISDIIACPSKPYCLYGIQTGISELEELSSNVWTIDDLHLRNSLRHYYGLTDVEIVSLAIHFPEVRKYDIVATGSETNRNAYPIIRSDRHRKMKMLMATGSFSGLSPAETKLIAPYCLSRSL